MTEKAAYTIAEVAALIGFSRQTVTRLFQNERGVLILERPELDPPSRRSKIERFDLWKSCGLAQKIITLPPYAAALRHPVTLPC